MKYFTVEEFVSEKTLKELGPNTAMKMINPKLVTAIQVIREVINKPIILNNWHRPGGTLDSRVFRSKEDPEGGKYSQHRLGNAVDFSVQGWDQFQLLEWIDQHQLLLFALGFTTMENAKYTPSWVHLDMRAAEPNQSALLIVNPR